MLVLLPGLEEVFFLYKVLLRQRTFLLVVLGSQLFFGLYFLFQVVAFELGHLAKGNRLVVLLAGHQFQLLLVLLGGDGGLLGVGQLHGGGVVLVCLVGIGTVCLGVGLDEAGLCGAVGADQALFYLTAFVHVGALFGVFYFDEFGFDFAHFVHGFALFGALCAHDFALLVALFGNGFALFFALGADQGAVFFALHAHTLLFVFFAKAKYVVYGI